MRAFSPCAKDDGKSWRARLIEVVAQCDAEPALRILVENLEVAARSNRGSDWGDGVHEMFAEHVLDEEVDRILLVDLHQAARQVENSVPLLDRARVLADV